MTFKSTMAEMHKTDRLEIAFKEAVAKLPDYKRSAAWEYVKHLESIIERKDKEIEELANEASTD